MYAAFRKNGPKSLAKRGQAHCFRPCWLTMALRTRDLTKTLGMNRSNLKDIVKKAERNGVTIESIDQPRAPTR